MRGVSIPAVIDTELPAAVAAADNMANPTAPQVLAHEMVWDSAGANWDRGDGLSRFALPTTARTTQASLNIAASGDNTVVAAVVGQTIRVWKILLVANAAVNIRFKDGAATDLTATINLTANQGIVLDLDAEPWFLTSAGNAFIINLSAAVQVSGRVYSTQS